MLIKAVLVHGQAAGNSRLEHNWRSAPKPPHMVAVQPQCWQLLVWRPSQGLLGFGFPRRETSSKENMRWSNPGRSHSARVWPSLQGCTPSLHLNGIVRSKSLSPASRKKRRIRVHLSKTEVADQVRAGFENLWVISQMTRRRGGYTGLSKNYELIKRSKWESWFYRHTTLDLGIKPKQLCC